MSHTQRELMLQGRRGHAVRGLSPHMHASSARQRLAMAAAPVRGVEPRRHDWFVYSVGGCEAGDAV